MRGKRYNVAVDMMTLYTLHAARGIGVYILNILRSMVRLDTVNRYYLLNFYGEVPAKWKIGGGENVVGLDRYETVKDWLYPGTDRKKKAYFQELVQTIIRENEIDIVLLGAVVDYYNIYTPECFRDAKAVTFTHDLIPLVFSKQYLSDPYNAFRHYQWYQQFLWSDYILSNSAYTKQDMVKYLKVDADRFSVIYGGASPLFRPTDYPPAVRAQTMEKFGVQGEYLFCVGADDFRKNLDGLVEAFLALPEKILAAHQLVITCDISKSTADRVRAMEKRHRGTADRLVVTGFVSDEEMVLLLNCAKIAVFPSMYEGLGLPVIEAWKCGVPVLTSNNSSLGEIAEGAAVTVDPFSLEDIRRGLLYALTEADLDELAARGQEKSRQYTYDNTAKIVLDSYEKIDAAEKIDTDSGAYQEKRKRLKKQCMKSAGMIGRFSYCGRR